MYVSRLQSLLGLDNIGLQLSTKHVVPELGGNTEAKLVLEEVVLQMVLLESLVPERKVLVVKEVVGQVIANVAKNATAVDCCRGIPVVGENGMSEVPKGSRKQQKHGWRHDQSVFVHGQIVVDAVEQEVRNDAISVVRKIAVL